MFNLYNELFQEHNWVLYDDDFYCSPPQLFIINKEAKVTAHQHRIQLRDEVIRLTAKIHASVGVLDRTHRNKIERIQVAIHSFRQFFDDILNHYQMGKWKVHTDKDKLWLEGTKEIFHLMYEEGLQQLKSLSQKYQAEGIEKNANRMGALIPYSSQDKTLDSTVNAKMKNTSTSLQSIMNEISDLIQQYHIELNHQRMNINHCHMLFCGKNAELKKLYKVNVLYFHPDKNHNSNDSVILFQNMSALFTDAVKSMKLSFFQIFGVMPDETITRNQVHEEMTEIVQHQEKMTEQLTRDLQEAKTVLEELSDQLTDTQERSQTLRATSKQQTSILNNLKKRTNIISDHVAEATRKLHHDKQTALDQAKTIDALHAQLLAMQTHLDKLSTSTQSLTENSDNATLKR